MSLIVAVLTEHGFSFEKEIPDDVDKWYPVICAYHGETNPSAAVNPVIDGFRCLACGRSGNSLKLVKEEGGLTLGSARQELSRIADEYGAELPQPTKRKPQRRRVFGKSGSESADHSTVRPRFRR